MRDPSAELLKRPGRKGQCWDCHGCYRQLSDHDPIAFVDGAPYCIERCVILDMMQPHKPHVFVCTRNMTPVTIRFEYTVPATTIHIRTHDPTEHKPAAGERGPRVAWIRELRNGRPFTAKGQGVLLA